MDIPNPCTKPVRPSPRFAWWLFERRLSYVEASRELRCTPAYVSALCLPFDDVNRREPGPAMQKRVMAYTGGDIQPNDWLAPGVLTGEAA